MDVQERNSISASPLRPFPKPFLKPFRLCLDTCVRLAAKHDIVDTRGVFWHAFSNLKWVHNSEIGSVHADVPAWWLGSSHPRRVWRDSSVSKKVSRQPSECVITNSRVSKRPCQCLGFFCRKSSGEGSLLSHQAASVCGGKLANDGTPIYVLQDVGPSVLMWPGTPVWPTISSLRGRMLKTWGAILSTQLLGRSTIYEKISYVVHFFRWALGSGVWPELLQISLEHSLQKSSTDIRLGSDFRHADEACPREASTTTSSTEKQ